MQLRRRKIIFQIYMLMIAVLAFILQPLWSASALALEPAQKTEIIAPAPAAGRPHQETKTTKDFLFTWQPAPSTSFDRYILRASQNKLELNNSTSKAVKYSSLLTEPRLLASQLPGFYDGTWYWQVLMESAAGNKSSWSEIWEVKLDTAGPFLEVAKPSGAHPIANQDIIFEGNIIEPKLHTYSIKLDNNDITSQVKAHVEGDGLYLSHMWPARMLSDGAHVIEVFASDESGLTSRIEKSFMIDTVAPEVTTSLAENEVVKGNVSLELSVKEPNLGPFSIEVKSIAGENIMGLRPLVVSNEDMKITRIWDTTTFNDGEYQVIFSASDAAGNKASLTRTVIVSNFAVSAMGSGRDPLLEELSANLNQPLTIPQLYSSERSIAASTLPDGSDIKVKPYERLLEEVPDFTAVAATENGWQLFGILWYWWLLGGAVLSGIGMYFRHLFRRVLQQQLPDGV